MDDFPISNDLLEKFLGDLDGPMIQPEGDRLAYLNAPASRKEVFDLLVHVYNASTYSLLAQSAQWEGDEARRLQSLKTGLEQNTKIFAAMRELLNAGVDPEWDAHA